MKKKILLVLSIALLLVGCGSSEASYVDTSYEESAVSTSEVNNDSSYATGLGYDEEVSEQSIYVDSSRKIVYTANITIETERFDEDYSAIKKLVADNQGYFENSNVNGGYEYHSRYGNFTIRVPYNKYQSFMDSVGSIGNITNKSESATDVTSQYIDIDARISSLNKKMDRLEVLEDAATELEDLLVIEDTINDTQYDIESYTAQLKSLQDKISYCTIDISLDEVVKYTPIEEDDSFLTEVISAVVTAWAGFIEFVQGIIICLIYVFPYALLIGIIAIIVFFIHKKNAKKRAVLKANNKSTSNDSKPTYKPVYEQIDKTKGEDMD